MVEKVVSKWTKSSSVGERKFCADCRFYGAVVGVSGAAVCAVLPHVEGGEDILP